MATQPFPYLVMTDGTTTITFADGAGGQTNYPPVRGEWAPAVAALRTDQLGGYGPETDVVETIAINIRDTTAAACYARLDALTRLLDQADRFWMRNEPVSPVVIKYAPQGSTTASTASPYQALVLGRAPNTDISGVALPKNTNDAGMLFEIDEVQVAFVRRGQWLAAAETPAASGTSNNPVVSTCTFATTANTPSPVQIQINGFTPTKAPSIASSVLLWADNVNRIYLDDTTPSSIPTNFSQFNDSANKPMSGTNVMRYTAPDTATHTSGGININAPYVNGWGRFVVYAVLRNNSASASFYVTASITGWGLTATTTGALIDTSSTQPRVVCLGEATLLGYGTSIPIVQLQFNIAASTASGSPTLDLSHFVILNLDTPTCGALALSATTLTSQFTSTTTDTPIVVDPRALTATTPQIAAAQPANSEGVIMSATGDKFALSTGTKIYTVWLGTKSNFWVMVDNTNTILPVGLTVTRQAAAFIAV